MLPTSTAFDIANSRNADSEMFGDVRIRARVAVNRDGFLFCQLMWTVCLTFRLAVLCYLIVHIGRLITQEKMIRTNAKRIVATVQNVLITGDFSAVNAPRYSVCSLLNYPEFAGCKASITAAMFENRTRPNPARRCLKNVVFKDRFKISGDCGFLAERSFCHARIMQVS